MTQESGKHEELSPGKNRSDRDLIAYEKQPEKKKELQRLMDLAEKTSGSKKAELHQRIRRLSPDVSSEKEP